jgi:hypothetical protein
MQQTLTDWERNKVGPYRILVRFKGAASEAGHFIGARVGKVYSAFRRSTGRRALVVVPSNSEHWQPRESWRVRVTASASPKPFLALEVEEAPARASVMRELADGFDAAATALEDLEHRPDAAAHLTGRRIPPRWLSRSMRAGSAVVGSLTLAACAVVVLYAPAPAAPSPAGPGGAVLASGLGDELLTAPESLDPGPHYPYFSRAIADDLPKKPGPGQATPKHGKCEGREEVINGGCWLALEKGPPCGRAYEWKGKCYVGVAADLHSSTGTREPLRASSDD